MMTRQKWDMLAAFAGLMSVFMFFGAWFVYGTGPSTADAPADILRFFANNYDRVVWSMFIQGLGALAMIWFMAALMVAMRDVGEDLLSLAAGLAFAVALALGSAATIMRSGIAFISVGDVSPDTVAVIFYLGSVLDTSQNIISAGFFLPVAVAVLRTRFIAGWWGWASVVAGLWAIASATPLDHSGFWSPQGAGFLNLVFYILWVGGTSVLLMKRIRQEQA